MQTKDIVNTGIDRNFLRKCIGDKIITPHRDGNKWINQDYLRYDFSQEDLESIWNAHLCRKMGLSYTEIRDLMKGESVNIRGSINDLIDKYEKKIEELRALIEFMRYVKGLGFIPTPPETSLGSKTFTEYLYDFIEYLDKDRKLLPFLNVADRLSNLHNIEDVTEDDAVELQVVANGINPLLNEADSEERMAIFRKLSERMEFSPDSIETQQIINDLYYNQKKIENNSNLTAENFACVYIFMLSQDSDISVMFKRVLDYIKEGLFDYFFKALIHFLIIQKPDILACKFNENKEGTVNGSTKQD